MDEMTARVREAERRFLRWAWWVFPAAGLIVAMLTGGGFWAWVDGEIPWLDWRQALSVRAAVLALAALAVAGGWRMLLRKAWPGWGVALAVGMGFVGLECGVRMPTVQTAFWLATERRIPAKANMTFQHDVCHVRLETAAMQQDSRPAVVIVGSSQIVYGVDERLLAQLLPERRIVKRAVASMRPLHALAASTFIPVKNGDVVVHYLSEFDFTNQAKFPYAWFRPFASWTGWFKVARTIGWTSILHEWRGSIDFALAATLETWRQRDWFRTAFFHIWGVSPKDLIFDGTRPAVDGAWFAAPSNKDTGFADSREQKRAMKEWVSHMLQMGASVVVFEGQVNPDWWSDERQVWHEKTAAWLASFPMQGLPIQYVCLREKFPEEDWKDHTHLNANGRDKLTRAMGRVLEAKLSADETREKR